MNRTRLVLLPLLVLAAALGVTWALWNHERQATRHEILSQFDFSLGDVVSRVEQRMGTYELLLRGVQSLFAASGEVNRDQFRAYVDSLNLDANFSGIQAIGIVEWVPATQKAAHIASMHRRGLPDYVIQPDGPRDNYAPIIQREPHIGANRAAAGFDAWADPVRRRAMEQARDTGMATITGKVRLSVDTDPGAKPGFVMYMPVYAGGQMPDNATERREQLLGWVYASFRMHDVVASLYGEEPPGLSIAIYDGVESSPGALLYKTSGPAGHNVSADLTAREYLVVCGHDWMLTMTARDGFKARFGRDGATLIAITGTGLSLLLALLTWLMLTGRSRAMRLASSMTKELRENEEKFRAIADCTVNWEIWWSPEGKPRWINSAVEEYIGYTVDECMVMDDFACTVIYPGDAALVAPQFRNAQQGSRGDNLEFRCIRKDGSLMWLSVSWVPITDSRGEFIGFRTSGRDITERKIADEKIKELAFYDALTGLPNRTLLLDNLRQALAVSARKGTSGALLFIDLDHFKTLNDTLGHDKGDLLLQEVAKRLAASIPRSDTVARVGGDEFVVVVGNLNPDRCEAARQTEALGETILSVLGSPYHLDEIDYRSSASIGATVFNGYQVSTDDLMKQADLAMYKSKERGRNAVRLFDPEMQTVVVERAALEAALRDAIENDQFLLHYQAQIDGERVTGAEALVRWSHPARGLVYPADFIPVAEDTGLIAELGAWVLHAACMQLARWAERPDLEHLTIAVNVSVQQLHKPDFVDTVLATLQRTGARPDRLKLELTESVLVNNVQEIIEKMEALKAKGIVFALDDFGIGYSSLSYLKRLPLAQLKIDRSFVRDVLVDPNDAVIARTIVALAHSLGIGVIAEGVETEEQRAFLASAGCYAYQGYLFCRPVGVEEFEATTGALEARQCLTE
ncbi:bifunctional diguanylate cyclase/phosphodiesterase [Paraburkholderia unamae]|uniref:PAS domain S-box-containing protein/diguanylate cyclase (GGDEF)-like protein n=1 Tax=Paraburkholderia unamae TaxID=219649 RepID=A0ABX5K9N1_9BURK|nr:EAL domain-containing protein [Paraburkholderia unamae]PVX71472.1 PAS domain S-box-containing protein/diguanylate cyclase (GGDEF)-like protein [Paraburkholderia unamae]CAG9259507.1 PAS domain S-box-containing protein/diguanylate cyclase (GGDEF)-like protein [Paraburkholderia unamae]